MDKNFLNSYRSTQWQEKKNKILTRDNYTCAICGKHGFYDFNPSATKYVFNEHSPLQHKTADNLLGKNGPRLHIANLGISFSNLINKK